LELVTECRAPLLLDPRTLADAPETQGAPHLVEIPDDERPLAVVATSGTTGRPRGVVLSRRAFAAAARASAENLGFHENDRWLLALPLGHVGGLSILTRCLFARRALVLPRHEGSFDPAALAQTIVDAHVTLLSLVPTQLARMLEAGWRAPASLRAVLIGGARAPSVLIAEAVERGIPAVTTYGLTEACSQVTTQKLAELAEPGAGRPLAGVELRVVDGEIQVRGATLMTGYHPAELHPDPRISGGWLPTRDLGFIDDDGRLHVLGRKDDVIVTGGEKVHPAEVEAVLERCPGVRACSVFGVDDDTWGARVAAAIVLEPGRSERDVALDAHVERELAPFKRPRLLAWLDELPLTASGKLDRRALHQIASQRLRPRK
jgi:O-succinylbenzoic acid--CoA ligase